MKKTYYDYLKESLASEMVLEEDKYILRITDFYSLLCSMLEEDLLEEDRAKVNAALAYLVSPLDAFPEEVYGLQGYVDDLFVMTVVLNYLYINYPAPLEKYWNNNDNLLAVLQECYVKSKATLERMNLLDKTLHYSGFENLKL